MDDEGCLVRASTVPWSTYERLAGSDLPALAGRADVLERAAVAVRAELSVALERMVPAAAGRDERRRLLALRRDVHNGRLRAATAGWDPATGALLSRWRDAEGRLRDCRAAGDAEIGRVRARAHRTVVELAADADGFGRGLLFANPVLAGSLIDPPAAGPTPRALAGGLAYLLAVVTKPTPFGAFSATGPATPGECVAVPVRERTHRVRPTVVALAAHVEACRAGPDAALDLPVSVNPTLVHDDGTVRWLRPLRPDAAGGATGVVDVPSGPGVAGLLATVSRAGRMRLRELVDEVRRADPATADGIEHLARQLYRHGALTYEFDADVTDRHAVARELDDVARAGRSGAPRPGDAVPAILTDPGPLAGPGSGADAHPGSDPGSDPGAGPEPDRAGIRALAATVRRLRGRVAEVAPAVPAARAVHDDCTLLPPASAGPPWTAQRWAALRAIALAANVFQPEYPLVLAVRAHVAEHGGADLTTSFRAFLERIGPDEPAFGGRSCYLRAFPRIEPELARWDALRAAVLDHFSARPATSAGALADVCAGWHTGRGLPLSAGYTSRPAAPGGPLELNYVGPGFGALVARHGREDPEVTPSLRRLRDRLAGLTAGARTVDVAGTFGTDLQCYPRVTERVLVPPGELGPAGRRLRWGDLRLAASGDAPWLLHGPDGEALFPVRAGALGPHALPLPVRFVLGCGGAYATGLPLLELLGPARPGDGGVRVHERRTVGDVVVLRATTCVDVDLVPRRDACSSDFGYLRAVRAWIHDLGLPSRCFVRPVAGPRGAAARDHKPFLLDVDNPLTLDLLERYTSGTAARSLAFTAMSPPTPTCADGDRRVCEQVTEVYLTGPGLARAG